MIILYDLVKNKETGRPYLKECKKDIEGSLGIEPEIGIYEIGDYLGQDMGMSDYYSECSIVVALNDFNEVLGLYVASKGKSNECDINIKNTLTFLLLVGASKSVVAHNHPIGDCTPSKEDKESYEYLKPQMDFMDIELIDDLVIGSDKFYSSQEDRKYRFIEDN